MTASFFIDKQWFDELAAWIAAGMVLVFGFRYLKQIIAYVAMELYRIFIQGGGMLI